MLYCLGKNGKGKSLYKYSAQPSTLTLPNPFHPWRHEWILDTEYAGTEGSVTTAPRLWVRQTNQMSPDWDGAKVYVWNWAGRQTLSLQAQPDLQRQATTTTRLWNPDFDQELSNPAETLEKPFLMLPFYWEIMIQFLLLFQQCWVQQESSLSSEKKSKKLSNSY